MPGEEAVEASLWYSDMQYYPERGGVRLCARGDLAVCQGGLAVC